MMRTIRFGLMISAALAVLPACAFTHVHETIHRSVPVAGASTVHIDNSVGSVTVRAWDKPAVDIVAVKDAPSVDGLQNIAIAVESQNSEITIKTVYSQRGFWNTGGVAYTIMVPANASLNIQNRTGGMKIAGVRGNVFARTTTGGIDGDLGKVAGNRIIDMRVTTGGIDVSIARDSSATLEMHTIVGGIKSAFSGDRIGLGTGRVHLETTTGGIALSAS